MIAAENDIRITGWVLTFLYADELMETPFTFKPAKLNEEGVTGVGDSCFAFEQLHICKSKTVAIEQFRMLLIFSIILSEFKNWH